MGVSATVIVNEWEAKSTLEMIEDFISSSELGDSAGEFVADRIVKRTLKGIDVNDNDFAPYSINTPKTGTPNLRDTGAMLNSISFISNGSTGAVIECESPIAQYHQDGTSKMPQREFMGLTSADEVDLVNEVIIYPLIAQITWS
ncbi:MAG: hypothetical protein B6244_14505 [Candidatus Cloacimonetes bacterium 4572_55]|nr:MAG: hypothetical protein B6244_14505 [Candidatus Cloacimonetes bacterium 4572_55]